MCLTACGGSELNRNFGTELSTGGGGKHPSLRAVGNQGRSSFRLHTRRNILRMQDGTDLSTPVLLSRFSLRFDHGY